RLHGEDQTGGDGVRHAGAGRFRAVDRPGHAAGVGAGALSMRGPALAVFAILALAATTAAERQGDRVVVRRDGVAFGVREPRAWRADLGHAAHFGAHVLF